ncbi:uncharacterized protein BKCO1_3900032 [Diplodia corticola]|uniref:Uncharacterized protein n=1 Tax=Diplodia corticola TaxID=236234 RepID=A0A1J9QV79_9PEZI|nr:uncharacterized protein BKCO1_3900032 [Diplodia corticola]OJD32297.1 hypothetical protein BKCO1_3900032 [Diplodia corticola]
MFAATRASSTMLRARPAVDLLVQARPARMFHATPKLPSNMPRDPHSAHTISQRIRQGAKAIPVEIYPLGKQRPPAAASARPFHTASLSSSSSAPSLFSGGFHHPYAVTRGAGGEALAIPREQARAEYVECATVAVIACGLTFGVYSFVRPGLEDPTLRLHRSRPEDRH